MLRASPVANRQGSSSSHLAIPRRRTARQMATGCAVSPWLSRFTIERRERRRRRVVVSRRTGWPCIKYHRCTHARTHPARYARGNACTSRGGPRAHVDTLRAFIIAREHREAPAAAAARRHARARACVSESGARRRDHPRVCPNAANTRR